MILCFYFRASWKQAVFRCKSTVQSFKRFVLSCLEMPWQFRKRAARPCLPLPLQFTSQRWVNIACLIISFYFLWDLLYFSVESSVNLSCTGQESISFIQGQSVICEACSTYALIVSYFKSCSVFYLHLPLFCIHFTKQDNKIFQFMQSQVSRGVAVWFNSKISF